MNLNQARQFKVLVNDSEAYKQLNAYADYRIEILLKDFLSATSIEEVRGLQKAIAELRRLKTLREEVNISEE